MTKDKTNKLENTVINSDGICFSGDDPCTLIVNDQELFFEHGVSQIVQLFAAQMKFDDLDDQRDNILREMNEVDRHIEHSEIYEDNLVVRAKEKTISMEDEFIQKATFEELKRAIEMLPDIQKKRIKRYYFDDLNVCQIAELEGVAHQVVDRSIKKAINNLRKILKKFN